MRRSLQKMAQTLSILIRMTANKDLPDFRSRSLAPLRREDTGEGCSSPFVVPPNRLSGSSNLLFQLLGGSPFTEIATSAEDRLKAGITNGSVLPSIANQKSKIKNLRPRSHRRSSLGSQSAPRFAPPPARLLALTAHMKSALTFFDILQLTGRTEPNRT